MLRSRAIVIVVVPLPPDQSFASDNAAGAHPRVIEALRGQIALAERRHPEVDERVRELRPAETTRVL